VTLTGSKTILLTFTILFTLGAPSIASAATHPAPLPASSRGHTNISAGKKQEQKKQRKKQQRKQQQAAGEARQKARELAEALHQQQVAAAHTAVTAASQAVTDAQTAAHTAALRATAARAAAEAADAATASAQTTLSRLARSVYINNTDPHLLFAVNYVLSDDPSSVANNSTVASVVLSRYNKDLTDAQARRASAAAAAGTATADEQQAVAALTAAGAALTSARKMEQAVVPRVDLTGFLTPGWVLTSDWSDYATLYETLIGASTMTWWDGQTGDVAHMCLKNAESVWASLGGGVENGMFHDAAAAGAAYAAAGLLHPYTPGTPVPRGMLLFWDSRIGSGWGHVAVSDGRGNFINNWGEDYIAATPLAGHDSAVIGYGPPTVFGHAP